MKLTILGSCRQHSLQKYYSLSAIQEFLSYPHYTEETLQLIRAIKGKISLNEEERRWLLRSSMIIGFPVDPLQFRTEFDKSDLFVIEIASRLAYKWRNHYAHHIITEKQYGCPYSGEVEVTELTDEEIEHGLLEIRDELAPKPIIIVSHIYTYTHGKRYELVRLLERLCTKHSIPFFDPMKHLTGYDTSKLFEHEKVLSHYTDYGHAIIGNQYKQFIDTLMLSKN